MDVTWIAIGAVIAVFLIVLLAVATAEKDGSKPKKPHHHAATSLDQQEAFGRSGESEVYRMLSRMASTYGGHAFDSFAFKDANGFSSEVDALLVCKGGVFVVEVKSNKGVIIGNLDEDVWYAKKEDYQEDRQLRNPIKQNQGHINHMKRMGGKGFPSLTSLVIFPYAKSVEAVRNDIVHDLDSAQAFIHTKIAEGPCDEKDVERFVAQIETFIATYGISHEEHLKTVRNLYHT